MSGEVKPQRLKQQINIFFLLQTTEYLPYYKHKCLDSEPSTFLLANKYIIFNKFDKGMYLIRCYQWGTFIVHFPHADLTPKLISVMMFLKCYKPEEIEKIKF